MINKAIAHITGQMMELNQPLTQKVEEHLTRICTTTEVANKLLSEEKTLKELNEKIWFEAKKCASGNMACMTADEVFGMAEKYYGITVSDKNIHSKEVIDIMDLI